MLLPYIYVLIPYCYILLPYIYILLPSCIIILTCEIRKVYLIFLPELATGKIDEIFGTWVAWTMLKIVRQCPEIQSL